MSEPTLVAYQLSYSTADHEIDNIKLSMAYEFGYDLSSVFPHETYRVIDGQLYPILQPYSPLRLDGTTDQ